MNRRNFLASASALVASQSLMGLSAMQAGKNAAKPAGKADHALRIEPCTL